MSSSKPTVSQKGKNFIDTNFNQLAKEISSKLVTINEDFFENARLARFRPDLLPPSPTPPKTPVKPFTPATRGKGIQHDPFGLDVPETSTSTTPGSGQFRRDTAVNQPLPDHHWQILKDATTLSPRKDKPQVTPSGATPGSSPLKRAHTTMENASEDETAQTPTRSGKPKAKDPKRFK